MEPLIVTKAEAGQKMMNFLERRVENAGSELHKWLRTGQVRRNGGRVKAFDRVEEGDTVRIPPFAVLRSQRRTEGCDETRPCSAGLGMKVVFEDGDILVVNKPAGLPSQGGTGHTDSVSQRLKTEYAHADFVPAPAHRLDKDTSGLLVVGKTYAALRALTDALAGRSVEAPRKEYVAWVWGECPWREETELRDSVLKEEGAQKMRTAKKGELGKEAISVVRVMETRLIHSEIASLVVVRLLTGRTHQIRLQLASRGFSIVGDVIYGRGDTALKLHAFRLQLPSLTGGTPSHIEILPNWPEPWNMAHIPT